MVYCIIVHGIFVLFHMNIKGRGQVTYIVWKDHNYLQYKIVPAVYKRGKVMCVDELCVEDYG